ncbi:MAG: archaemetzincin [Archangium sp.]|nr:archaemetzincin [Archangium sp.]MDP3154112.1 archaemetzincin [Archangium sp.]MDP3569451.1 archaemetzincin [Archangium sp.]
MGRILAVSAVLVGGIIVVGMLATTPPPPRAVPATAAKPRLSREEVLRAEALPEGLTALTKVAQPKLPSREGDWLTEHPEEGQSLAGHRADCQPVAGRTIYLVPTGELQASAAGARVMDLLEPLLAAHFQLKVKRLPALDRAVAGKSERKNDLGPQWLTQDILEALLKLRPDDAAAVMAITTVDLYPDPTWNFVFGEASYDQRVGVMSLARTGDVELEKELVLKRSYGTAMHEIGHMFQLQHCVAWECPMNGCNHQEESDSRPLEPCPHCLAKLMRATGLDPNRRWAELRAAFEAAGLTQGVKEIDRELQALKK